MRQKLGNRPRVGDRAGVGPGIIDAVENPAQRSSVPGVAVEVGVELQEHPLDQSHVQYSGFVSAVRSLIDSHSAGNCASRVPVSSCVTGTPLSDLTREPITRMA